MECPWLVSKQGHTKDQLILYCTFMMSYLMECDGCYCGAAIHQRFQLFCMNILPMISKINTLLSFIGRCQPWSTTIISWSTHDSSCQIFFWSVLSITSPWFDRSRRLHSFLYSSTSSLLLSNFSPYSSWTK